MALFKHHRRANDVYINKTKFFVIQTIVPEANVHCTHGMCVPSLGVRSQFLAQVAVDYPFVYKNCG